MKIQYAGFDNQCREHLAKPGSLQECGFQGHAGDRKQIPTETLKKGSGSMTHSTRR